MGRIVRRFRLLHNPKAVGADIASNDAGQIFARIAVSVSSGGRPCSIMRDSILTDIVASLKTAEDGGREPSSSFTS
jgi:hypothetical protein